ncbi:S41 family peptidase [Pedobacter sp. PLR]|uniref:S41 family peptidase n=1 Tax=Pedobacter sp. PLR TaxID=2994465 RepID=UPI0022476479|nr:S41 family peptidase [Pedobacter sp. PLR]MCX2451544.1 S41 family peptidase [Pedobacter sp. PLR]
MMKSTIYRKYIIIGLTLLPVVFSACKKNKVIPEAKAVTVPQPGTGTNTKQTPTTDRRELTNDSLFLYAQQIYYWNETLPTYDVFDPRTYKGLSTDLANFNNELFNITKYSTFETVPGSSSPKYAFIRDENNSNGNQSSIASTQASVDLQDIGFDMGILNFQGYGDNNNYQLYVKGVYTNSPADLAKITRGTRITNIGGQSIGTNFNAEVGVINGVLNGSLTSTTVSGVRTDGTVFTNVPLKVTKYTSSPVFTSKVIDQGGKKIGYLAYARFSVLTVPNDNNPSDSRIDPVFAIFAASNVSDLVIDLRYNGGGSVQAAEYLLNLIAPANTTGVMFKETYNNTMKSGNATILANQPLKGADGKFVYNSAGKLLTLANVDWSDAGNVFNFSKKGPLNGVKNIFFLVSENTASASELLINCIKPHVQSVKLVGQTTYGKPVGFFPITLDKHYSVYLPSFESKNSRGEGGYYAGIKPDYADVGENSLFDDSRYDFGDPRESYLNKALSVLAPVAPSVLASRSSSVGQGISATPAKLMRTNFSNDNMGAAGMVETRYRLKN